MDEFNNEFDEQKYESRKTKQIKLRADEAPVTIDWAEVGADINCPSILISAVRRSGKSFLTREMLYELAKIQKPDLVVLMGHTAFFNTDFEYVSSFYKYDSFREDVLKSMIEQQEKTMLQHKKKKEEQKNYNKEPPKLCFIFDDIVDDSSLFYNNTLAKLFILGRHLNIMVVFLTQYLKCLPPRVRSNSDILISFRQPDKFVKKYLMDAFMSLDQDSDSKVKRYFDSCFDEEYKAMIICVYKIQKAKKLNEYILTYKAPKEVRKFRLGQAEFWNKNMAYKDTGGKKNILVPEADLRKAIGTRNDSKSLFY